MSQNVKELLVENDIDSTLTFENQIYQICKKAQWKPTCEVRKTNGDSQNWQLINFYLEM